MTEGSWRLLGVVGFIAGLQPQHGLAHDYSPGMYTMIYHLECRVAHPETLTDNHCSFLSVYHRKVESSKARTGSAAQSRTKPTHRRYI
jgi:hypothetical protein